MTVQELIDKLNKYPKNSPIFADPDEDEEGPTYLVVINIHGDYENIVTIDNFQFAEPLEDNVT